MKRLSIIMSAVLMAIFFTACSQGSKVEITKDYIMVMDLKFGSKGFLEYQDNNSGCQITINSTEGKQHIRLNEQYDVNQYQKYHFIGKFDFTVNNFLSMSYGLSGLSFSNGVAFRTNGKLLVLLEEFVTDPSNIKVHIEGEQILPTKEKAPIPALVIKYSEGTLTKQKFIPILEPKEYLPEHGRNNLEELINSGKLKCAKLISE